MFCSISGEVPLEAVVSRSTGHLYEKKLIQKYIKETGKCPISGKDIDEDDLIVIHASKVVKPRAVATASIPGLLATFQNEWDEVMLETFTLKQHLDTTRQELSQALYQHDASCRVIARLMKERDEARAALSALQAAGYTPTIVQAQALTNESVERMDTEASDAPAAAAFSAGGLGDDVIAAINDKCAELSQYRRTRKPIAEGLLARDTIAALTSTATYTPHKTSSGAIQCLALTTTDADANSDSVTFLLTGGADKEAVVTAQADGRLAGRLKGHHKKVTSVAFHPVLKQTSILTASADKTIALWSAPTDADFSTTATAPVSYSVRAELPTESEVTGLAVHPTGKFFVSLQHDGSWGLWDHDVARLLRTTPGEESFLCGGFHPDGVILGAGGARGSLRLWDVREQSTVASFEHADRAVTSLAFSENGYLMVSGCEDGQVRVWDLRKQQCTKTIAAGGSVSSVVFDRSGLYLASAAASSAGGKDFGLQVHAVKGWGLVSELASAHTKTITGMQWGADSATLVTASLDRVLRVFSAPL